MLFQQASSKSLLVLRSSGRGAAVGSVGFVGAAAAARHNHHHLAGAATTRRTVATTKLLAAVQRRLLSSSSSSSGTSAATKAATRQKSTSAASSNKNPLTIEADSGALATHLYHRATQSLAVLAPVYFLVPESYSDGAFAKLFGVALSANVATHAWIGLNYVATDYVPKVSKALLRPFRYVNLGMAALMFFGLAKVSLWSPGGIKAVLKGPWNGKPKKDFEY